MAADGSAQLSERADSTNLEIFAKRANYRPNAVHDVSRIWLETNCYMDLWAELLHALQLDPVPAFACALSADHDGVQWTFLKPAPEDLRRLYGLEVAEENVWRPVLDTVESGPARGLLFTVEVDSWWLPDTAGTAYRTEHVKTTIVPTRVDRTRREMEYLHNAGMYELHGEDFDGVFGLTGAEHLPPYIEAIRRHPDRIEPGALATVTREHLRRRAPGNPVERLAVSVREAVDWLPNTDMTVFHKWSFATLRQCGATAELGADFARHLDGTFPGAAGAAEPLTAVAEGAKAVQFKMARAARGRAVDVDDALADMADAWQRGLDLIETAVG